MSSGWHHIENPKQYYADPARILEPGTCVLIQNLQNDEKKYLNGQTFHVFRYDQKMKRYVIVPDEDEGEQHAVGLLKRENLVPLSRQDWLEHRTLQTRQQAALYDPNGPHPPKRDADKDASAMFPLLKAVCPNVDRHDVQKDCLVCGKTPDELLGAKMMYCSRCSVAPYCCRECQRSHWRKHKPQCTTRNERMQLLRSRIADSSSMKGLQEAVSDEVLETALNITQEFVDGAYVLITACNLQASIGDVMPEECIIHGIRQLCNVKVTAHDMLRLAEGMGLAEELETGRKAKIADFQRQERDMETPRAMALKVWHELLRPLVVRSESDDVGDGNISGIGRALKMDRSSRTVLELCDFNADRCETVRLDQGKAVVQFLLLLDELTRHILTPGADKKKDINVLLDLHTVSKTLETARDKLQKAWLSWVIAFEGPDVGPNPVDDIESNKNREMSSIIRLNLENPFTVSGRLVGMTDSSIDDWLAAEPGRWLPFNYTPGGAIGTYTVKGLRGYAISSIDNSPPV